MVVLDTHDEFLAVLTEVRQVNPSSPVTCTYAGTLDTPTAPLVSNGVCQTLDPHRWRFCCKSAAAVLLLRHWMPNRNAFLIHNNCFELIDNFFNDDFNLELGRRYPCGEITTTLMSPGGTTIPALSPGGTTIPALSPGGTTIPPLSPDDTTIPPLSPGGTTMFVCIVTWRHYDTCIVTWRHYDTCIVTW
jgi:hypothetical protein